MQELIKIEENNGQSVVSARDLHQFLGSKQDFSDWIKKRISRYGFIENQDYTRLHKKMEANNATSIEYALTLDMAKELSMVECNAKGREARLYFIERDKKLTQIPSININRIDQLENQMSILTKQLEQAGLYKFLEHDVSIQSVSPVMISPATNRIKASNLMTVPEYAIKYNIEIDGGYRSVVSIKAMKWCRKYGQTFGKHGTLNAYPKAAIDAGIDFMNSRLESRKKEVINHLKNDKTAQSLKMLEIGDYMIFPYELKIQQTVNFINKWTDLYYECVFRKTMNHSYKVTRIK